MNGAELPVDLPERRLEDGRLEMVGIEASEPSFVKDVIDGLVECTYKVRIIGTIAVSLCQVADVRFDGMITARNCRAIDVAAAQLIVREAGGCVLFTKFPDPLSAPLDLAPHSPVVAARSTAAAIRLASVLPES